MLCQIVQHGSGICREQGYRDKGDVICCVARRGSIGKCGKREVTADWRQLFGDRAMPKIVGIGVITDSENTGSHVTGWHQNLELLAE